MIRLVPVYSQNGLRRGAVRLLYRLLRERPPQANISHRRMPTLLQHEAFVRSRPYREWFIVEDAEGHKLGAVYLTHVNEIGVAIFQRYQGEGYAEAAVRALIRRSTPAGIAPRVAAGRFIANVAPGNKPSHRLFRKLGAAVIQITYALPRGDTHASPQEATPAT